MAPALVQLFAFMACTFALGLFLGWSLWRYGGISRAAMNDLVAKVEFWKKSLDQSRIEVWKLQEAHGVQHERVASRSRPISRSRTIEGVTSRNAQPSTPG